jgi:antitoxin (DNA-binding transcriptional repressor) of toxin-antitoxin stability system
MAKTVAAAEADWPVILQDVKTHHEEVVITEDGQPIARLVPVENPLRGPMYGTVTFHGDIMEPLDEEWDADQ